MTSSATELEGRVALVTGGASGLGRAICLELAARGADIVILTLRKPKVSGEIKHFAGAAEAAELQAGIERLGRRFVQVEGDAADAADVDRAVSAAEAMGGVGILVNNAATNCYHVVEGHDVDAWRRVIDVDLLGPFLAIRACLPGMNARRYGRIVSIGSTNAHQGSSGYSAYCAAKHGLLGLHKAVALEVDARYVTLTTVSPGWVDTPSARLHMETVAADRGITTEAYLDAEIKRQPQQRIIAASEIAKVVAFVVGSDGRLIHDADIRATGGARI
jgi:3-hydroxybutyrate dehydrogenase